MKYAILLLIIILLFLFYKFYTGKYIFETLKNRKPLLQFVITSVNLNKGITPRMDANTIIQLTNNTSKILKTIPRTRSKTKTVYGMIDHNGNNIFKAASGYDVWISPLDMSGKAISRTSTKLELIGFKDSTDYKKSVMTSIGTISVYKPVMYQSTKMQFQKGKKSPNIPPNAIFYLSDKDLSPKDKGHYYNIYNIHGVKYKDVLIKKKDSNKKLLGPTTKGLIVLNKSQKEGFEDREGYDDQDDYDYEEGYEDQDDYDYEEGYEDQEDYDYEEGYEDMIDNTIIIEPLSKPKGAKAAPAKAAPAKGKPVKGKPVKGKPAKGKSVKAAPAKAAPAKAAPAKGKPAKGKSVKAGLAKAFKPLIKKAKALKPFSKRKKSVKPSAANPMNEGIMYIKSDFDLTTLIKKRPVPTIKKPVPTTKTPIPTTKTPVPTTKTPVPTTKAPVPQKQQYVPHENSFIPLHANSSLFSVYK